MRGHPPLPLLRPGRTNKSLNVWGILRRLIERIRKAWPACHIQLRGDSHFCSHEFMDRVGDGQIHVDFVTGIAPNATLLKKSTSPCAGGRRSLTGTGNRHAITTLSCARPSRGNTHSM